jgi:hypothetical protein
MDDDAARDGLDHLQAAAKELIAAARSLLDAAEAIVQDPGAVRDAMSTIGSLVTMAGRVAASATGAGRTDDEDPQPRAKVQRIVVE